MGTMTIGKVAKNADVNIETIRYYERRGLIPKPPRRESGYRQYGGDTIQRVKFIKRAQGLGFSLREVSDLLTLRVDPQTTCADVMARAEVKIDEIDGKIRALKIMKEALSKLVVECTGEGPSSECPILEALNAVEEEQR